MKNGILNNKIILFVIIGEIHGMIPAYTVSHPNYVVHIIWNGGNMPIIRSIYSGTKYESSTMAWSMGHELLLNCYSTASELKMIIFVTR